jgi:3-oxoacyl-[acyl-carrier protein] reductase
MTPKNNRGAVCRESRRHHRWQPSAIAMAFAHNGAQTVIGASSAENLSAASKAITEVGPEPLAITGDLRQLQGCEQVLARVKERFGRCDILINNAGATRPGKFMELTDDAFLDGFALKYFAAVRLTRLFWPMLKSAQGHVVNIVGCTARSPEPEFLVGSSVNAAVANFSKGLSKLGMRDGINVNAIHPGNTRTERQQERLTQRAQATGVAVEELRAAALTKSGIRRFGEVEDIAALALFLCSECARHIQGTAIAVDGGATVGYY